MHAHGQYLQGAQGAEEALIKVMLGHSLNSEDIMLARASGCCAADVGCGFNVFFDRPRLVQAGVKHMYRGHPATESGLHATAASHGREGGARVCWLKNVFNVATYRCGDNVGGESGGVGGKWGGKIADRLKGGDGFTSVEVILLVYVYVFVMRACV